MAKRKTAGELASAAGMQARLISLPFALLMAFFAPQSKSGCYQLFNQAGDKIYEGSTPPFDISYPDNSPPYQASRKRGEYIQIMPTDFCDGAYSWADATATGGRHAGASHGNSAGSCSGRRILHGPRGGAYCITDAGQVRYLSQD